ncbi:sulfotransferase domain-containing protein [Sphingosinicella sp. CPCC 101087]|uniref:sulfotransferase domain-containing protein n=1 Tax=Sphingosinicella sp. CPCC 101087 TaxID=2497754 RepID=UPI00101D419B|nr:sulfotransferase domain-containing protein [Sphingosinicella sp. CPCC 101087]
MLPNLIVIGAMKSATSSLHHYLSLHPEIEMSRTKELDFFVAEKNWERGIEWYKSNFVPGGIRGESSPNYTVYPEFDGVPERMHRIVPGAKLIYLVRDPIDRMISHYIHSVYMKREQRTPDEALSDLTAIYLKRSLYYSQIERYLSYYPLEQIMIVMTEELMRSRGATLRSIFAFLGVDHTFEAESFDTIVHSSTTKKKLTSAGESVFRIFSAAREIIPLPRSALEAASLVRRSIFSREMPRPTLSQSVRDRLSDRLAPDVANLRALTGKSFDEWSI